MKATYVVSKYYLCDRAFDLADRALNRDNCLYWGWLLRERLAAHGYELATQDRNPPEQSQLVIYADLPRELPRPRDREKSVLFLWESEIIKPENYDLSRHANFRTIYTWRDDLIDGKRYRKMTHAQKLDPAFDPEAIPPKDIAMIAANKRSRDPRELYSKRLELAEWFELNAPDRFDLFGMGWDRFPAATRIGGMALSRLPGLAKSLASRRPSWRGPVASKRETLSKYRFTIAFENARDVPGYVTEKILDPMLAGSIPVYWGAPNVNDLIPDECLIDARNYSNIATLCEHLLTIDTYAIRKYRKNILDFFTGTTGDPLNIESEIDRIVKEITEIEEK